MNTGRGVLRTWWLAVALLLVGVGLILPAQAQEKAPAVQQTGEPTQPQAAPQDPDPARAARRAQRRAQRQAQAEAGQAAFEIDVRAPADVRDVIARRLELRRFAELTDLDDGELLRLLPTARTNAEEILATLGFFSPTVRVEAVAATDSSPRRIVIDADPGEPTLVTEVNIAFTGPIATDETARGQRVRIEALWPLRTGMQFTQAGWDAAKLVALRELTTVHHPNGRIADSRADIDPETRSARLQITLDSGPVFKFGKLVITGLDRHSEELVVRLAQLPSGERYEQSLMLEVQQRLSESQFFDAVFISLDTSGDPEAAAVKVQVREESGSFEVDSLMLRAGRTRSTETVDRSWFLQYEKARNTGFNPPPDANALSANYVWTHRDFDSRLFPTAGQALSFDVGGGVTVGDTRYPFGRFVGRWLHYWPIGWGASSAERLGVVRRTRIATRAEFGAVVANANADLPTTQLFLTGGDNSVRGYAYRSIGVTLPDGQTAAGRYLAVGSVELQRPIAMEGVVTAWDFIAFIDAGDVANQPQALRAQVGYGAGAQWNSPLGPLQVSLAWGVATRQLRLNLSMGVQF